MRDAGNDDRNVLVNGVKESIHTWPGRTWWPSLVDNDHDVPRGYAHTTCAEYIAPFSCDPTSSE
jgi:hypothetical protein